MKKPRRNSARTYGSFVYLIGLLGCGAHSVDLDQVDVSAAGSSGSSAMIETLKLTKSIVEFHVDESRVYWITQSEPRPQLQSCVYEDCERTMVTYGESQGPIVVHGDELFFPSIVSTSYPFLVNTLLFVATSGASPPRDFTHDEFFLAPAADAKYLYWGSSSQIVRCPLTGCGEIPQIIARSASVLGPLILQGDSVYWLDDGLGAGVNPIGPGIYAAPVDGSSAAIGLAPTRRVQEAGLSGPETLLAVDSTTIYWLDSSSHVQSCPRSGCNGLPPVTLVATDTPKRSLMADDAGIYWLDTDGFNGDINQATGTVRFCPLTGCSPKETPQALTPNAARKFRLSSKYLFWDQPIVSADQTSEIDQLVFRTVKPSP